MHVEKQQSKLSALISLVLLLPLSARADWGSFDFDFDEDKKPWQEIEAQLPAAPKPANLRELNVGAASSNQYLIDITSLSLGEDGVARYTVVARSPHGTETVNFEGMHCASAERKIYAFGRKDGTWSRNRYAKWEPVKLTAQIHYAKAMYEDFLCPDGVLAKGVDDILRALKSGKHAHPTGQD